MFGINEKLTLRKTNLRTMDAKLFLMAGCLAGIVSACVHEKSDDASDIQKLCMHLCWRLTAWCKVILCFGIGQLTSRIRKYASMTHLYVKNWTVRLLYVLTSRLICWNIAICCRAGACRKYWTCCVKWIDVWAIPCRPNCFTWKLYSKIIREIRLLPEEIFASRFCLYDKNSAGSTRFSDVWFCPNWKSTESFTDAKWFPSASWGNCVLWAGTFFPHQWDRTMETNNR